MDLSQRELLQLGYVILEKVSVRASRAHAGTRHLVGESVDGFG